MYVTLNKGVDTGGALGASVPPDFGTCRIMEYMDVFIYTKSKVFIH